MAVSKISISYLLVLLYFTMGYLSASGPQMYKMLCDKSCLLLQDNAEVRVAAKFCFKGAESSCLESIAIADDGFVYTCKHESRSEALCTKSKELSFLLDLIREESQNDYENELLDYISSSGDYAKQLDAKRSLPFETLSYGKRKRSVSSPMNDRLMSRQYNKDGCDCSKYAKRGLPFETLSYGKRSLPFETLSYGKREDGSSGPARLAYILGKRND